MRGLLEEPSDGGFSLTTIGSSGPATFSGGILNIPQYVSGSGSNTFVYNEVVGGSATTFTLAHTPVTGLLSLSSKFGKKLFPTQDWSISGAVLTMVDTWNAGEIIADNYQY